MTQTPDTSVLSTLPLRELAAFEAAVRLGSFAKAAEELCVTQSAVSHRIRQLEARLGHALFARSARRITPLPASDPYLAIVREALAALKQADEALDAGERQRVRLAIAPALGTGWLLPRIANFRERHPRVRFEVTVVAAADDPAALASDVLIHYGARNAADDGAVQILADEVRPVCAPRTLEELGPFDDLQRFLAAPLVRHSLLSWRRWFESAFGQAAEPAQFWYFDDAISMLESVASGVGVALSTRVASEPLIAQGRLVHAHAHAAHLLDYRARLSEAGRLKRAAQEFLRSLG